MGANAEQAVSFERAVVSAGMLFGLLAGAAVAPSLCRCLKLAEKPV